ncbi:MAG: hypothetical protein V4508_03170 [Pseudomonadota bacterium]
MTRSLRRNTAALLASAACLAVPAMAQVGPAQYHLEHVLTIPSSNTGWDYSALDQQRQRIFIAHRKDGLHVYDIKTSAVVKTLENSQGANTAALAPEFDLGVAGTTDGQVIVFTPSSLATLARYQSSTSGFDGATYDAVSQRFAIVGEADPATRRTPLLFFNGRDGQPVGRLMLDSAKVDAPRADGKGNLFLPLRDKAMVIKVDARSMQLKARLPLQHCVKPAALEMDEAGVRLFVGCRGDARSAPALAVLDAASGNQLATLPIGHGVDEVMVENSSGAIITANGDDASMTVIVRPGGGKYRVAATIGTRPRARTGVLDQTSGKIYLVSAEYIDSAVDGAEPATAYLPNTFSVLTYAH